eukprot:jgi/Picre1/35918/NNA_003375.t1
MQLTTSKATNKASFASSRGQRVNAAKGRKVCVVRAAAQADPKKRVVVTGMGIASVFGNDYDTYYNQLLEGVLCGSHYSL